MSAVHRGIHLPFDLWPAPDQAAWEALFAEGNPLDGCGAACHWAEATRRTNRQHYARWLAWLEATGALGRQSVPSQRANPDRVRAYVQMLMGSLSARTTASAVIGLKCVLQRMHPEAGWRWLKHLTNRVDAWADTQNKKVPKLIPAGLAFDKALGELARLAQSRPLSPRNRIRYRDTLIVALLTCCPIRMRNLTQIEVGKHLRQVGSEWQLCFGTHETKSRQPLRHVVAPDLIPWLDHYLAEVRPGFPRALHHEALWSGSHGSPLAYATIYSRVIVATKRLYGIAINPHSFRTIAATALAERSPEDALFARPLLGHRSPVTTERHYIRANQLLASERINTVLQEARNDGGAKT